MQLNFESFPSQEQNAEHSLYSLPVVIIPGLFGSSVNWRSFAKQMAANGSVYVIDQRNHGRSPHSTTNSYADLVSDLMQFLDQMGFERVALCGHSMGGKVAMMAALQYPQRIEKLAVLDIAPTNYESNHASLLRALMQVDLASIKSRSDADRRLQPFIPNTATRLFLLQSLEGSVGAYRWRLNLPVLLDYMDELSAFPKGKFSNFQYDRDCAFILGGESDYVTEVHYAEIQSYFPGATFHKIPLASHWLHADQPILVLGELDKFLKL